MMNMIIYTRDSENRAREALRKLNELALALATLLLLLLLLREVA
jgi:hypothetical protein